MLYQASNLMPNQNSFEFKARYKIYTPESGDTHYFIKLDNINYIDVTAQVDATTEGYYYIDEIVQGNTVKKLVYLPLYPYSQNQHYYLFDNGSIDGSGVYSGRLKYVSKALYDSLGLTNIYTDYYTFEYYENPFSFYINGNSNFRGYKIEIFQNSDNKCVYDSGVIERGYIEEIRYNISLKSEEYRIYPYHQAPSLDKPVKSINISPVDYKGNNVKIYAYLPKGIINLLTEGPNVNYNWVLTQYYELNSDGSINTNIYTRNAPVFFVSKPVMNIGIRAYTYDLETEKQKYLAFEELSNYQFREIYLQGYQLYEGGETSYNYVVDNYFNNIIEAVKWNVKCYNRQQGRKDIITDLGEKDYVITSSLFYNFQDLIAPLTPQEGEVANVYIYDIAPQTKTKYRDETEVNLYYIDAETNTYLVDSVPQTEVKVTEFKKIEDLSIIPSYQNSNLEEQINFTAKECNKQQYIELSWKSDVLLGEYYVYENGEYREIIGDSLRQKYKNISSSYNAGGGEVERTLTSIYVADNDKLEYSNNFHFTYNSRQVYLRYCNIDNLINKKIISFSGVHKQSGVPFEYYLSTVSNNGTIVLKINCNNLSYVTDIEVTSQYWHILQINLFDAIDNSNIAQTVQTVNLTIVKDENDDSQIYDYGCAAINNFNFPLAVNSDTNTAIKFVSNPNSAGYPKYEYQSSEWEKIIGDNFEYKVVPKYDVEFGNVEFYPRNIQYIQGIYENVPTTQQGSGTLPIIAGSPRLLYYWDGTSYTGGSSLSEEKVYVLVDEGLYRYFYCNGDTNSSIIKIDELSESLEMLIYPSAEKAITSSIAGGGVNGELSIDNNITFHYSTSEEENEISTLTLYGGLFNYLFIADLSTITINERKSVYFKEMANIFAINDYSLGYPRRDNIQNLDFLANYNLKQLNGGAMTLNSDNIRYWILDRVDIVNNKRDRVGVVDVGANVLVKDYNVPNNWKGHYEISPASDKYLGVPVVSKNANESMEYSVTNWDGYSLLVLSDPDKNNNRTVETVFYWRYNINTGEMSNNTNFNVQETLKRFKRISKSQTNAISGSLQSLLGYYENGIYHGDSVEVMDKIYEVQMSNKMKILKDRNGKNYIIEFTSPVGFTQDTNSYVNTVYNGGYGYNKNIIVQPTTLKLNWIEVAQNVDITAIIEEVL